MVSDPKHDYDQAYRQRRHTTVGLPRGPFTSDPGWHDALWWLVPLLSLIGLFAMFYWYQQFYLSRLEPEGYGVLEVMHAAFPSAGALIVAVTLSRRWVRSQPLISLWLVMMLLGCLYIAGEESSWGQHFFHWQTPEYWAQLNAQKETNLHNVADFFGKAPRFVLTFGIISLGLILPVQMRFWPRFQNNSLVLFLPPPTLIPTAAILTFVKVFSISKNSGLIDGWPMRLSEVEEFYIYLFLIQYKIILRRRILEAEKRYYHAQ